MTVVQLTPKTGGMDADQLDFARAMLDEIREQVEAGDAVAVAAVVISREGVSAHCAGVENTPFNVLGSLRYLEDVVMGYIEERE